MPHAAAPSATTLAPAPAPAPAAATKSEPPHDAHFVRRDSRLVDIPVHIAEEDESTASEPTEPHTPTSHDFVAFTHPFRNDEPLDELSQSSTAVMADPKDPKEQDHDPVQAPPPVSRTASNMSATPEKPGFGKRVGSFVRSKLHRAPSHKDGPPQKDAPTDRPKSVVKDAPKDKPKTEKLIVKTGVDGPAEVATPAVNIPRYGRRLSSFSLSARNSAKSSRANSPPLSGSPTSTISDEQNPRATPHKRTASSTALAAMAKPKTPGISWANNNGRGGKRHAWSRRRSASTEQVPQLDSDEERQPTIGMINTFSQAAERGVGLKSRRLSLSLPDEFVVDSCALDKEFQSSSRLPGKRGKSVGKGATAEVRIMARRGGGHEDLVAVKEFRAREEDETEDDYLQKIKSEFTIARSLHHPNIVETVRLCTHRGRWNHVMEYCTHGELYTLVERKLFAGGIEGYYSPEDRLCFFKQLLRGVGYLHSHGIAHRDIKLENLLLSKEGHLKISDFGVAEVFSGEHPGLRASGGECGKNMGEVRLSAPGICGSLPYIAPEVLEKKGAYDPRPLDVWSCAIVYLTMTFGGCPWQAAKPQYEYYARFKKGWDEWLTTHPDGQIVDGPDGHPKCGKIFSLVNPPAIKRLILKMLHPIPEKRITIHQVLESACIRNINCCCPENYEDPKCCVDATKANGGRTATAAPLRRYLHHHVPPKPESKIGKALTHRFDMGDGW